MTTLLQDDELLMNLLAQHSPRRAGCLSRLLNLFGWILAIGMFLVVMARVLPDVLIGYGIADPETVTNALHLAAPAPQTTPLPTAPPLRQQPPLPVMQLPAPLPDCATVQDTRTACLRTEEEPAPTAAPTPSPTAESTGFWTAKEQAQFAATAQAYYDPATLPTVEPAFATAVQAGCDDPAKRAASPLLASWCAPLDK